MSHSIFPNIQLFEDTPQEQIADLLFEVEGIADETDEVDEIEMDVEAHQIGC